MTADQLNEIEARANAATEGPWNFHIGFNRTTASKSCHGCYLEIPGVISPLVSSIKQDDREFIAASRTDIPLLVAEVRRLKALVGEE